MVIVSINNLWSDQLVISWQRIQTRELNATMAPKTAVAIGEQIIEFSETAAEYSNIKNPLGSGSMMSCIQAACKQLDSYIASYGPPYQL